MFATITELLNSNFIPAVVIAPLLAFLTYKQTRAGQRDTREMQEKADSVSETQKAMLAYKDLYETEHERRLEAEGDLKTCRSLVRRDFETAVSSILDQQPNKTPEQKGQQ